MMVRTIATLAVLLAAASNAMGQSLSEATQANRLTVMRVDAGSGTVWFAGRDEGMPAEHATVVSRSGETIPLQRLHQGDVVRVRTEAGRIHTISVLRRASDDLGTPD